MSARCRQPNRRTSPQGNHARYLLVASAVILLSGCQTLTPFRASVRQKTVVLREWTHRGLDAMQNGRLAQARSFFTRAASQSPQVVMARVNLARADARLGDLNSAIDHMQAAVKLTPDDPGLLVELGELYFQSGRRPQAVRQAELALAIDPKHAGGWALQGKTWHAQGKYDAALANYQRALSYQAQQHASPHTTGNEEIQMLMAEVYHALGKPTRALATVEQLLSHYPHDRQPEPALLAKGRALMQLNQFAPAIDVLGIACDRPDASVEAFVRLGEAQVASGQLDRARATIAVARWQHPSDVVLDQLASQLQAAPVGSAPTAIANHASGHSVAGPILR